MREKVKPERDRNKRKVRRQRWWQFAERAPELYATIAGMERVLFHSFNGKYVEFGFVPRDIVFGGPHVVLAIDDFSLFALLQSTVHTEWVWLHGSSLRKDLRYVTSDCFETFPLPPAAPAGIGGRYYAHRQEIMQSRKEGLTKTYNRFHNPRETSPDLKRLRELHVEMDHAVASAYGWANLDLGHGFHKTKQGLRFTLSEPARREVLARLLRLNHERHAAEVAAVSPPASKAKARKAPAPMSDLFGGGDS